MTAYSEHYSLPEYERGDLAQLISVYNVAIEIIDDLLFGLDAAIKDLQGRMTTAEGNIDTLGKRIQSLKQWREEMKIWVEQTDAHLTQIDASITNVNNELADNSATWDSFLEKVYGGGTVGEDGTITWGVKTGKIAIGDLNVFSGIDNPTSTSYSNALRSRALSDNDIKAL